MQTRFVNRPPDDYQVPEDNQGPLPWEKAQPQVEERFPWAEQTPTAERAAFPWEQAKKDPTPKSRFYLTDPRSWRIEDHWPTLAGVGAAVVVCSGLAFLLSGGNSTAATGPQPITTNPDTTALSSETVTPTPTPTRPRRPRRDVATVQPTTVATAAPVPATAAVTPSESPRMVSVPTPTAPVTILPGAGATPTARTKEEPYRPYQGLTKEDLRDILKDVGRKEPFSPPPAATLTPVLPPPPAIAPIPTPPRPLEPSPTIAALAYSPTVGWLGQVQLGEQVYDVSVGSRVGTWTVRSMGNTGMVLVRGRERMSLRY